MRVTKVLFKQSIWRMTKFNWQAKSKRRIIDSKAEEALTKSNIVIEDANDIAALPKTLIDK